MAPSGVPSAWDDDYEALADSKAPPTTTAPTPTPLPSRAARLAAHHTSNATLWATASSDSPTASDYQQLASLSLSARSGASAPTTTTAFKPQLKVLSRKPAAPSKEVARQDERDAEEERAREEERRREERRVKAEGERREKERRYREVRARLFGDGGGGESAGAGGEGAAVEGAGEVPKQRGGPRERGSGGAGGFAGNGGRRGGRTNANSRGGTAPTSATSSAEQSPARGVLYDPTYTPKPGSVFIQRREQNSREQSASPGPNAQHVRQPRGPDGSGRGGSGFAARGRGGLGKT